MSNHGHDCRMQWPQHLTSANSWRGVFGTLHCDLSGDVGFRAVVSGTVCVWDATNGCPNNSVGVRLVPCTFSHGRFAGVLQTVVRATLLALLGFVFSEPQFRAPIREERVHGYFLRCVEQPASGHHHKSWLFGSIEPGTSVSWRQE